MRIQSVNFSTKRYNVNFGNQDTYEKGYKRGVRNGQSDAIAHRDPNIEPPSTPHYKTEDNRLDYIVGYNEGYEEGYANPFKSIIPEKSKIPEKSWEEMIEDSMRQKSREEIDRKNARIRQSMEAEESAGRLFAFMKGMLLRSLPVVYGPDEEYETERNYRMISSKMNDSIYDDDEG